MSVSDTKLNIAVPAKGVLVATVILNGKRCNVFAQLEDDKGNLLPMPASFESATMAKVQGAVEALLLAHEGKCIQDKAGAFDVKDITAEGLQLVNGTGRRTHDFAINSILKDLPPASSDILSKFVASSSAVTAKNLWEQIESAIQADTQPKIAPAITPPPQTSTTAPSAPPLEMLKYVSPFEERIERAKLLNQCFKNPASIDPEVHRNVLDPFKIDFSKKLGRPLQPSDAPELEKALQRELDESHATLRLEKAKLKEGALKIQSKTEAGDYLDMAKKSTLFDAEAFYYFIYEEAIKKGINIPDWDKQWAEFHAVEDLDIFANAINKYINSRLS